MHYLVIAVVVFAVALVIALAGCGRHPAAEPAQPTASAPADGGAISRAAIAKKLTALAKSKRPTKLTPAAVCYSPAGPHASADYVCPLCGEKTLYSRDHGDRSIANLGEVLTYDLAACRRLAKEIRGLDLRLDETEFCRKCRPDAKDPRIMLVVRYAAQSTEHRTRGVALDDLRLIQEFLAGADKHTGDDRAETPLKDHLPRLAQLLGVVLDEGK